ncbi:hypothetical protein RUM43_013027 [Polyplax serrata]|uniref:N-acetyltransferase domain-containing protein n=1 Tax=Polyplax serrata TaxID=468196 RepID=A0AAN8RSJ4_POLSC
METSYKVVRVREEHIPGVLDVLRQSFFPDEKVCSCLRILQDSEEVPTNSKYKVTKASRELENLALECIKDGVSICAVDTSSNEVLGVNINKIQVKPKPGELSFFEKFTKERVKEDRIVAFMDFMVNVDSRYDLFGTHGDCYFEIAYLSVKSTANGKGIGTTLVTKSAELAQKIKSANETKNSQIDLHSDAPEYKDSPALKTVPKLVSAIFTSRFSQKCGARSGFAEVLKIPYTEFSYEGRKYSETTGPDHPFCTLSVKMLV